ncbi:MAG: site-specific integrase [Deltaproteobacteria bacterium]|nr:site-specific integrase [Deltaproteobacteria bacterium]
MSKPTPLSLHVKNFFTDYLRTRRNVSPHTILTYRDAIKALLSFVCERKGKKVSALEVEDLSVEMVLAFLEFLETEKGNSISTRNLRLAAIRSLFQHIAGCDPERINQCRQMLSVPQKRTSRVEIGYLEPDEVKAFLQATEGSGALCDRDKAIVAFLFNTGARVSELVALNVSDVRWDKPFDARILGKGRKERFCPLWPETVGLLKTSLLKRNHADAQAPLFANKLEARLTRFGVREMLARLHRRAGEGCPTLRKKRVGPHTFRHTAAVHLLRSGVEINVIKAWLGHSSIETTSRYIEIDMAAKRTALEKCEPLPQGTLHDKTWKKDHDLLDWLKGL